MIAAILLVLAWSSAFAGSALIALVNRSHRIAATGSAADLPSRRGNAAVGRLLLLAAAILAIVRDGWGMGLLLGPLLIASAIATIIAILALRPGALRPILSIASWRPAVRARLRRRQPK